MKMAQIEQVRTGKGEKNLRFVENRSLVGYKQGRERYFSEHAACSAGYFDNWVWDWE